MPIRVLIVDDEPLARRGIRARLDRLTDFEVVGECASGRDAVWAIGSHDPDLVFLDVQMPELDGFGVIEAVGADRMPYVVFVTAHDEFAIRAFDTYALDYLLKPIETKRFEQTLDRVREEIKEDWHGQLGRRLAAMVPEFAGAQTRAPDRDPDSFPATGGPVERLAAKSGGRVTLIPVEEIDWIEAEGNYARLHVGEKAHLVRERLTSLEHRLDPNRFVRIHRSVIVRLDRIRELRPHMNREYVVVLRDGTELKLSRTFRDRLDTLLGGVL